METYIHAAIVAEPMQLKITKSRIQIIMLELK